MRRWPLACLAAALVAGCAPLPMDPVASPASAATGGSVFRYPWSWQDEHGARVAFSSWRGRPLVITAIYTSCRETCPRTIVKLHRIYDELVRTGVHAEVVVVTLDPETDTPEGLRAYRQSQKLPAAWHLVTGNRQDTDQLMDVLDVHVLAMDAHLVHDSKIVMFDATGARTGELAPP